MTPTSMKKARWDVMDKTTVRGIFEYDQSIMDRPSVEAATRFLLDFEDDDGGQHRDADPAAAGERASRAEVLRGELK